MFGKKSFWFEFDPKKPISRGNMPKPKSGRKAPTTIDEDGKTVKRRKYSGDIESEFVSFQRTHVTAFEILALYFEDSDTMQNFWEYVNTKVRRPTETESTSDSVETAEAKKSAENKNSSDSVKIVVEKKPKSKKGIVAKQQTEFLVLKMGDDSKLRPDTVKEQGVRRKVTTKDLKDCENGTFEFKNFLLLYFSSKEQIATLFKAYRKGKNKK